MAGHQCHVDDAGLQLDHGRPGVHRVGADGLELDHQGGTWQQLGFVLLPEVLGLWACPRNTPWLGLVWAYAVVGMQLQLEGAATRRRCVRSLAAEKKHSCVAHCGLQKHQARRGGRACGVAF
jgi:hypothetical protein